MRDADNYCLISHKSSKHFFFYFLINKELFLKLKKDWQLHYITSATPFAALSLQLKIFVFKIECLMSPMLPTLGNFCAPLKQLFFLKLF